MHPTTFANLRHFCLFIGYPCGGHSLVGSVIDAHPNACVSHELDALSHYHKPKSHDALFTEIMMLSAEQAKNGRASYGYHYAYKGQQGMGPPLAEYGYHC